MNNSTNPIHERRGAVSDKNLMGRKFTDIPPTKAPVAFPTFIADCFNVLESIGASFESSILLY